jgi:type VI secretion system secreted protein VgrG
MPLFSQDGRLFRVKTALGDDVLLLAGFTGKEVVSRQFLFELDLISESETIDPLQILRTDVTVSITLPTGDDRHISGVVRRFVQQDRKHAFTAYRAEVVPASWFLSLSRDSRIFQNLTVREIIAKVFDDAGFDAYDDRCTKTYPKREYCVQYDETHLDFVSRLMEEEGIFYFFEHTEDGHTLVLADANTAAPQCLVSDAHVGQQGAVGADYVHSLQAEHAVRTGNWALKDYDFQQPALTLLSSLTGTGEEERFEYPGKFTKPEEGDRYAKIRLEESESLQSVVRGFGDTRSFAAGHKFKLEDHYRADLNVDYLLLEVQHWGTSGDFVAGSQPQAQYRNQFVCIPHSVPYRPPRLTQRPVVRGTQSALVVGPAGEEIYVDKYGRVKLKFFWDRSREKDETSSCWVRVSTAWAGKGWGTIQIPRIGQEVLVDFLEGDPDLPVIVGRVYNADQVTPYDLPANKTQSGVKSRSSTGGGTENFNEIRFEDKKGSELFYVHAEKDKQVEVEHDRTENVGNDEKITIGNDRTEEVGNNETIKIGADRTEEVGSNESIDIGGNRTEKVAGNESIEISGNEEFTVSGSETVDIGGSETVSVGSSRSVEVGSSDKLEVGSNLDVKANSNITVKAVGGELKASAATKLELKVGPSKITITPAGIELSAPKITIKAMGMLELKAPMATMKADAMLQLKGAIAQLNGDGVLMIKGGITMIN